MDLILVNLILDIKLNNKSVNVIINVSFPRIKFYENNLNFISSTVECTMSREFFLEVDTKLYHNYYYV